MKKYLLTILTMALALTGANQALAQCPNHLSNDVPSGGWVIGDVVTITNDGSVAGTWTSSDEAVATISDQTNTSCKIHAVGSGHSVITFTAPGCSNVHPHDGTVSSPFNVGSTGGVPSCDLAFTSITHTNITCNDANGGGNTGTVTVVATGTGITFNWSWMDDAGVAHSANTQNLTGMDEGLYNLKISATHCADQYYSATIEQPNAFTATAGDVSGCAGANITLSGSSTGSGGSGAWSVGTAGVYNNSTAGGYSYTYTYTDGNGCTASATSNITVKPNAVASAVTFDHSTICAGSTATASATATYGTGAWSSNNGNVTIDGTSGAITTVQPGASSGATITFHVTSNNGCADASSSASITVNPNAVAAGITGGGSVMCVNDANNTTTLNFSDGATYGTGAWSVDANGTITTGGVLTGTSAGTANVTYTVTSSYGCANAHDYASVTVNGDPGIQWNGSATTTTGPHYDAVHACGGTAGTSYHLLYGYDVNIAALGSGGTGPYTYHWNGGFGTSGTSASSPVIVPLCTSNISNTACSVSVSDNNGCYSPALSNLCLENVSCTTGNSTRVAMCRQNHSICVDISAVDAQLASGATYGNCGSWKHSTTASVSAIDEFSVYPNPTDGMLNVAIPTSDKDAQVQILDMTGRVIAVQTVAANTTAPTTFNLANVPAGMYIVQVTTAQQTFTKKVVVTK